MLYPGLGQVDPLTQRAIYGQTLLGLGGRLLQPAYSTRAAIGNAMLGSMTDLAQLTRAAQASAAQKRQEERIKQEMEWRAAAEERRIQQQLEMEKLMSQYTGAPRGTYSEAPQKVPGDAQMPGAAYHQAIPAATGDQLRGLGQQLLMHGALYGNAGAARLGESMLAPSQTREIPSQDGTKTIIQQYDRNTGQWKDIRTYPNWNLMRRNPLTGQMEMPTMNGGEIGMRAIGGSAPMPQLPPSAPRREDQGSPGFLSRLGQTLHPQIPENYPPYVRQQQQGGIMSDIGKTIQDRLKVPAAAEATEAKRLMREREEILRQMSDIPAPKTVFGFRVESDQALRQRREEHKKILKIYSNRLDEVDRRLRELGVMP